MNQGQSSCPFVAREVCAIEQLIREEPIQANVLKACPQGVGMHAGQPDFGNSLPILLSGTPQQLRASIQQSSTLHSMLLGYNPLLYQMNSSNSIDSGSWSILGSTNLPRFNRAFGLEPARIVSDLGQGFVGQGVQHIGRTATCQDSIDSVLFRATGPDMHKQTFSAVNNHKVADLPMQSIPPWLVDSVNPRHQFQIMQGIHQLPTVQPMMNPLGVGGQQFPITPRARPRVYCRSHSGSLIGGELVLTDTGHLGVVCLCHSIHMPIAKFSEHAGIHVANPGSVIYMESGETLLQWRKMFLSQLGVKLPEDCVDWEWTYTNTSEVGCAKCRTAVTPNWQEMDSSYRGQRRFQDIHDIDLKNCGDRGLRGKAEIDIAMNQVLLQNAQVNMTTNQKATLNDSLKSTECRVAPVRESVNFIENGSWSCVSEIEQRMASVSKNIQPAFGPSGCYQGPESVPLEKGSLASKFDLRPGQGRIGGHSAKQLANYERVGNADVSGAGQMDSGPGRGLGSDVSSLPLKHFDGSVEGSSFFPGQRCFFVDSEQIINRLAPAPAIMTACSSGPLVIENNASEECSRLAIPRMESRTQVSHLGANVLHGTGNVFGCLENQGSILREKNGAGSCCIDNVMESMVGSGLPMYANLHNKFSACLKGLSKEDVCSMESTFIRNITEQPVVSNLGLCHSLHDLLPRNGLCASALSPLTSSNQNLCEVQVDTNQGRLMEVANAQDRALSGDGCELQHVRGCSAKNFPAQKCRIQDGLSSALEQVGKLHESRKVHENQEQWQVVGISFEKNGCSKRMDAGIIDNNLRKSVPIGMVKNDEGNFQPIDSNAQAVDGTGGKEFENSISSQTEMNVLQCKCSEQKEQTPEAEEKILTDSCKHDECDCSKCTKERDSEVALTRHTGITLVCTKAKALNYKIGESLRLNSRKDSFHSVATVNAHFTKELGLKSPTVVVSQEGSWTCVGSSSFGPLLDCSGLAGSSGIIVSVGENDCAVGRNIILPMQKEKKVGNSDCETWWGKDAGGKYVDGSEPVIIGTSGDALGSRAPAEDLLADTAAKGPSIHLTGSQKSNREYPLSDASSEISEILLSEFSDGGHITDEDTRIVISEGRKLMNNDAVDEGSGIGKCFSSDGVEMCARTKGKPACSSVDAKLLESPSCDIEIVQKWKNKHKSTKLQAIEETSDEPHEVSVETPVGPDELKKKKWKIMRWKKLYVAAPLEETKRYEFIQDKCNPKEKSIAGYLVAEPEKQTVKFPVIVDLNMTPIRKGCKGKSSGLSCQSQGSEGQRDQCLKGSVRMEPRWQCRPHKTQKLVIKFSQGRCDNGDVVVNRASKLTSDTAKSSVAIKTGAGKRYPVGNVGKACISNIDKKLKQISVVNGIGAKTAKVLPGRKIPKATRMASLSSILKLPAGHVSSEVKEWQTVLPQREGIVPQDATIGLAVAPTVQERQFMDLPVTDIYRNTDCPTMEKEQVLVPSVKVVRKRSLRDLTVGANSHQAATSMASEDKVLKPAKHCTIIPSNPSLNPNDTGSKRLNTNPFIVPRAERSVRLKLKYGNMPSLPVGGLNAHKLNYPHSVNRTKDTICNTYECDNTNESVREAELIAERDVANREKVEWNNQIDDTSSALKMRHPKRILVVKAAMAESKPSKKQKLLENVRKVGECSSKMNRQRLDRHRTDCAHEKLGKRYHEQAFTEDTERAMQRKRIKESHFPCLEDKVTSCCVCGSSLSEIMNQLLQCRDCCVKVHQACYGIARVPKSSWLCRPCKVFARNIFCVLCGYVGGAMTRARKAGGLLKGLAEVWEEKGKHISFHVDTSFGRNDTGCILNASADKPRHVHNEKQELMVRHPFLPYPVCNTHLLETTGMHRNDRAKFRQYKVHGGKSDFCGENSVIKKCSIGVKGLAVKEESNYFAQGGYRVNNTVADVSFDRNAMQWVHMVCALWMPGTKCLNVGTMAAFDVSGVAVSRRRLVCSLCKRPGGACIQCHVAKCSTPFHAWCAHEKGQLQSENLGAEGEKVGFFGRCSFHMKNCDRRERKSHPVEASPGLFQLMKQESGCARMIEYKRREISAEHKAATRKKLQEQFSAWLQINEQKTCIKHFIRPSNSNVEIDYKEYLRFKQERGWKHLVACKSGIHALGVYTAEFISKGAMVAEYTGEVVGLRVADKREVNYQSGKRLPYKGACYLFRIDKENFIDATHKGSIARFVNHSCSPNCVATVICLKNQRKVIFFAVRDIYAGEEVTYDYKLKYENDSKIPCFCNSKNCRGYLNWIDVPVL